MSLEFTRREVLAGLVGAPLVALTGCGGGVGNPGQITGEIVGASADLGHRLRTFKRVPLPEAQYEAFDIAIVGGGIAGLSAAWHLRKQGCENFVLLELEPVAGGTSRSGQLGNIPHPWGAHYLPTPLSGNTALIDLLDEMGMIEGRDEQGAPIYGEQYLCRDPEERLFAQGSWHEGLFPEAIATDDDRAQLRRFQDEVNQWIAWRDPQGRRAFTIPVAGCSDAAEVTALDRLSFAQWLDQRQFTSSLLRWWLDYACRDDYGLKLAQTSAWAGLFYFAARTAQPGHESQPLLTWPEGNGRLAAHLQQATQTQIRSDHAVASIAVQSDQTLEIIALRKSGEPIGFRAKQVIFAAPQFLTPYLIADWPAERAATARQFTYGSWLVANLQLRARPHNVGFAPAWDNVLLESESLGYVTATHQLGRDHGPTVWTYYYPLCDDAPAKARERLLAGDWSHWSQWVLNDLAQAHPDLPSLVERIDIMRWGHAMIRPAVGFVWGGDRQRAAQPWQGIHFAHCDLSGVALFEEAFDHGVRAAQAALAAIVPAQAT